jgi:hypothetical protein
MKLYTEEQVIEMTQAACIAGQNNNPFTFWEVYKNITPIELPSDDEIKKMRKAYIEHVNTMVHKDLERDGYLNVGFHVGAKSMRDKIQGGNNDKQ